MSSYCIAAIILTTPENPVLLQLRWQQTTKRRFKLYKLKLPFIFKQLYLSNDAKYLGVILYTNLELNWAHNRKGKRKLFRIETTYDKLNMPSGSDARTNTAAKKGAEAGY